LEMDVPNALFKIKEELMTLKIRNSRKSIVWIVMV